ncbi:DNA sulfur modification protein DndD [Geitlerinema sp. PCC 9228]|uniref:DNA sulfur modification protein DndD n=1 Tax=Geitlerinema sp. PCC 9228 TaxID=111611 RepID=UPI0008F9DDAF|nr:DNA sulfur modification protein DndD [Geitlerinema sp. PCC 9228]
MRFTELVLNNFGPYLGYQTINLRPEDDKTPPPIVLFGGMNGGGKTTLMDAIRLALYGPRAQCSTRGNLSYSDFLSQCVHNQTPPTEKTRIELAFEHVVGDRFVEHRIVRTWGKNPKDGKDQLGILEDDWKDEGLTETWDEYIETLLPLGISNLFLFDGEQVKELAEQDEPPPLVFDAIQSLLGLELADRLAVDLDVLVSRKRKELANKQQLTNLEDLEQNLQTKQSEYEAAEQEVKTCQQALEKARSHHQATKEKLMKEGGEIAGQRNQLEAEIQNIESEMQTQRDRLREIAADSLPLKLISPLLQDAKHQGEQENQWQEYTIARDILHSRDQRLLDYLQTLDVSESNLLAIQKFLESDRHQLDIENDPDKEIWLHADTTAIEQIGNLLDYQLPSLQQRAQECLQKLTDLEQQKTAKERQLAAAASPETYQQLVDAVSDASAKLKQAEHQYQDAEHRCQEIADAIAKLKKQLQRYSEEYIDRENANHIIQSSARVKQTLQRFKERLTLKKLNKLETEVTECFRYLLHKSDLVHRVVIDTQTYSLSLYDSQGNPVPKHRLSAGEKQLLAISFLWGLARVSGHQLPIAIDTPLGRLDSSHRQNLVERYFPAASHQVILLSTDTEIAETEVNTLRQQKAIAHEYLLEYNAKQRQTTVKPGYFF